MSTIDPLSDFYLPGPAAKGEDGPDPTLRGFDADADDGDGISEQPLRRDFAADDGSAAPEQPLLQPRRRQAGPDSKAATREEAPPGRGMGSLLAAVLLLAAMLAGGWYLAQPETLPIRQVNIEGEFQQLSQAQMQQIIAGQLRGGFFSMDVARLREAVKANPWVRDVQVQRVWPDAIKVAVREQVAVARWKDSGLVNSAGDFFQPDLSKAPAGLPQISGPAGMQAELTTRLLQLQEGLAPLGLEVKQLTLSDRRAWSFVTRSGLEVVLGREDFDARLARFADLVPTSLGERLDQAAYIDMRYTNGFAVQFNHEGSGAPGEGANEGNGAA